MEHNHIPQLETVRASLACLNEPGLRALSAASGVPFPTLRNIRYGLTTDPGYGTVRAFIDLIPETLQIVAHQARAYRREQEAKKSEVSA